MGHLTPPKDGTGLNSFHQLSKFETTGLTAGTGTGSPAGFLIIWISPQIQTTENHKNWPMNPRDRCRAVFPSDELSATLAHAIDQKIAEQKNAVSKITRR